MRRRGRYRSEPLSIRTAVEVVRVPEGVAIPESVVRESVRSIFSDVPVGWLKVAAGYSNPAREDDFHYADGTDMGLAERLIGPGDSEYTFEQIRGSLRGAFDFVISDLTSRAMKLLQTAGAKPKEEKPRSARAVSLKDYQQWIREAREKFSISRSDAQELYRVMEEQEGRRPTFADLMIHPRKVVELLSPVSRRSRASKKGWLTRLLGRRVEAGADAERSRAQLDKELKQFRETTARYEARRVKRSAADQKKLEKKIAAQKVRVEKRRAEFEKAQRRLAEIKLRVKQKHSKKRR